MRKGRTPSEPTPPQAATLAQLHPTPKREGEEGAGLNSSPSRFGFYWGVRGSDLSRGGFLGVRAGSSQTENRIVVALIAVTLLASCLPYLLGYYLAPVMGPHGAYFVGTPYNIDDYCNYLSWLRQMADGRFFIHNLFTTDPQKGLQFNVFFWLLGRVMAVTRCTPQVALQMARIGGGLALLWLLSRFYRHCLPDDPYARLTAFGFICLSSGFGWMQWQHWQDKNLPLGPVDAWQPEAYTFLSIYTSALMTVSTVFIVGALYALLLGEQTGKWKYPILAGICGGILGNMHSYDVLHISAAWGLFLIVLTLIKRGRGVGMSWARGIVALALTAPTTLYVFYLYRQDAVFQKRANVPTLAPWLPVQLLGHTLRLPVLPYVLGYGLVFLLAVLAAALILNATRPPQSNPNSGEPELREGIGRSGFFSGSPELGQGGVPLLFAVCWAVAGLGIAYFPIAFQRKMLMGEHIPLCLLAGVGAAWLARRFTPRFCALTLSLLVLATLPSNVLFLKRDMRHLETAKSETHLYPFLDPAFLDVYHWLRANTPPDAAIVGFPGHCTYLPGEAGRAVWAGHWAETPEYGSKDAEFADAFDSLTPDADRHAFLLSTRAQYLFYPNDVSQLTFQRHHQIHQFVALTAAPPAYLKQVYKNDLFTVYEIK